MSGFAADWLDAREPLDHASRSAVLAGRFAAALGPEPRLLDLGSGTGSNIRYLKPRLGRPQLWLALDHDPALLEALAQRSGAASARDEGDLALDGSGGRSRITPRRVDLNDLDRVFALGEVDAVTASALLDLTSADWLDRLAGHVAAASLPALFALSFDGRMSFAPERAEDEEVRSRFLRHQRTDKGFGPALGPDAALHLASALRQRGRAVELAPSDWRLGP
ncbi:MAG: class I SAM-dependent methyltransferase, partial [Geminicoccaceae bacterium]|nr:class I SAM-dependent methyltransferase [Geminicoccaceae bacterium]